MISVMKLLLIALLGTVSSCVTVPTALERYNTAENLAHYQSWQQHIIHTEQFDLISYQPIQYAKEKLLTVYIEGDGLAWLSKSTVSNDPTPINPVGLKLALNHSQGNASYLARPCQYTGGIKARNCNKHYWTDSRFSEEVIDATNNALNTLKAKFNAQQLQLVGYSGGGAVAVLIAARRNDVVKLITIAGNLDHHEWTNHHNISPLSNSLNPVDYHKRLARIEQVHFVGANDKITPPLLVKQFVAQVDVHNKARVIVIPKFDHYCCWVRDWTSLISMAK